jgi:hypothetical protein
MTGLIGRPPPIYSDDEVRREPFELPCSQHDKVAERQWHRFDQHFNR